MLACVSLTPEACGGTTLALPSGHREHSLPRHQDDKNNQPVSKMSIESDRQNRKNAADGGGRGVIFDAVSGTGR